MIGWKACRNGVLLKLEVTPGGQWNCCNADMEWYRASEVKILEAIGGEFGISMFDNTEYHPGQKVRSDKYTGKLTGCCHGIHFFLSRWRAEKYGRIPSKGEQSDPDGLY